ncbi:MAG: tRNA pseudouridine(38-40) synthase TruA, partial [Clostridia bacterium]|nr:tRNA pseudouridine(38-40) synthase TruA [Clostridia bacterium]
MRYVLKIAYDGTAYAGWQRQKNALSVQECLENALESALGIDVRITASGRTDAGVHAAGQTCHFDLENVSVPPEKMPDCLNRFLPPDIRAIEGWGAADGFDCNRSAKRKTYCYSLYVSEREMPLKERFAVRIDSAPPLDILRTAAQLLEGEHDYKAF